MMPDLIRKSHNLSRDELTVEGGDVVAVVSSDTPDDEGEVVVPKNLNLDRFRKVRQVYFDHDLEQHPVGSAKWIKCDGGKLISKHFFAKSTELARAVGDLVKEGVYRCYSIGCMKNSRTLGNPTKAELQQRPEWAGKKIWRGNPLMIEYSVVGQAANPDCVALAVSKSWSRATVELLTGVNANNRAIVTAVAKSIGGRQMTEADVRHIIGTAIGSVAKRINPDAIVERVIKNLGANGQIAAKSQIDLKHAMANVLKDFQLEKR